MENKFKFYNTLTRNIDTVIPHEDGKIAMYTCGPTVYHFAHIGNLRTYVSQDIMKRMFIANGYKVHHIMNITDVGHLTGDSDEGEDKMLLGAKRENKTVLDIARFYTEKFKEDCANLNIKWPEIVVPATSCIDEYINMIEVLLEKGYAYKSNGNVYFDVSKLDNYYIYCGTYGETVKNNIDDNKTYYLITDTYSSQYVPNHLTEIERYGTTTFARDLLAEYIRNGGFES